MAEYKVNYTQSNFTGGIIAAELYGRNDFNKVKSGLKKCVNWTIREAGGLEFRRGTEYIGVVPTGAGTNFKSASIDDIYLIIASDGVHWWRREDSGAYTYGKATYPSGIAPNLDALQFVELQRRLYIFDGAMKLCQVKLDSSRVPYLEVTKFEGELPEGTSVVPKAVPSSWPSTDVPTVQIDYQYAIAVAKDEDHESIALVSDPVKANAELGSGDDNESQRIDVSIVLTSDTVSNAEGGKALIYRKYQGKFYYLDSVFLKDFQEKNGNWEYTYSDKGQFSPDVSRAIKEKPEYLNSDGSIAGVTSIADYGQRIFMTLAEYGTNIIFTQVGNFDSLAYSELRNEDEAGYLEVPVSHYDNWCKVVAGLDLIFSTSYTISQIQGYGDLQLQTVLFDGFSKTVQPVTTRRSMIYTNSNNRNIYDLTYNEYGQYDGIDLTLLVKYIFETKTIKRLAFKDYPVKTIYVLCDDGDLYCLTYIKDQNIYAWYQIQHTGKIHDLLVINKDTEDEIYMVIETDRLQYTKSYDWHSRVGGNSLNREIYDEIKNSIKSSEVLCSILSGGSDGSVYVVSGNIRDAKKGDKLYYFSSSAINQIYLESDITVASEVEYVGRAGQLGNQYRFTDSTGVVRDGFVPDSDEETSSSYHYCRLGGVDTVYDVEIEYQRLSDGRKVTDTNYSERVISLYENHGITSYIVFDEYYSKFWGRGYTTEQIPVYIIERAYHRTDNVYMDSVVHVSRSKIVDNQITGLPDHMIGKKVRVFDLGNNRFYGEYDNANSKSVTQGGVTVQIDDVDFDGYEVAADGSIQLEDYIELEGNVLVGFPYYAVAETIPLEFSDQNGNSTIGRKKNITEAYLRYGDSRGLSYKTLGKEYDCKIPSKEISDTAEFLERGQMRLDVASEYKWDSTIKILQREPYPARIESITLGLHFNDKS